MRFGDEPRASDAQSQREMPAVPGKRGRRLWLCVHASTTDDMRDHVYRHAGVEDVCRNAQRAGESGERIPAGYYHSRGRVTGEQRQHLAFR